MTLPANIRVNVRAPFPTQVNGSAFVQVSKANGVWTINPDYRILAKTVMLDTDDILVIQDIASGSFSYISALAIGFAAYSTYRFILSAGTVNVQTSDAVLLFNASPAGVSFVNLPPSASRNDEIESAQLS